MCICYINYSDIPDARTVVLHRAKRGFGFILRGAKAASPLMQLKPSERCPGLQYLDDVDPGGVADLAGLQPGDFLLAVSIYCLVSIGRKRPITTFNPIFRLMAKMCDVHRMSMWLI